MKCLFRNAKVWVFILLCLGRLGTFASPEVYADWDVRRKDRWHTIAKRLFSLYITNPKEGYALRRLVLHYRKKGGTKALYRKIYQAHQKNPKNWRLDLAKSLIQLHSGGYDQARKSLLLLQQKTKKNTKLQKRLRWYLARAYFRTQHWVHARVLYVQLYKQTKQTKRKRKILRALIQLDIQRRAWKQAITWYTGYLKTRPKDIEMRLGLSRTFSRLKRWPEAIQALRIAIKHSPRRRRPRLWSKLVRDYLETKQYPKALQTIERTRRSLAPKHWLRNALLSLEKEAHRGQKTLPLLLKRYAKRAKQRPKQFLPLKAQLHGELKQLKAAFGTYRKLLDKYPQHPAFTSAISLMMEHHRTQMAISWLRKHLKRVPGDEKSSLQLLTILHQLGQIQQRDRQIKMWLTVFAKNHTFLQKLERTMRPWKSARIMRLHVYKQLCNQKPPEASCFERWGLLLWQRKRQRQAWQVWSRIGRIKPLQPTDLFLLARIYTQHGRQRQSIPLLKKVLKQAPKHIKAHLILARTYVAIKRIKASFPLYRAIPKLTRSLRLRRHSRQELLIAYNKLYDQKTVGKRLRRDYMLAPFSPTEQKMLLAFHMSNLRYRYVWRYRYVRSLYRRRYRRSHRRWHRRRYRRRYRAKVRQHIPPPHWVRNLLKMSLLVYPNDPEFHLLALKMYKKTRRAWRYLAHLVFIDQTQTSRYIEGLKQQARKFKKWAELLRLSKKLSGRWPHQAKYWALQGSAALQLKLFARSCRAFTRASRIAPRRFIYRQGRAKCLAAKKEWHNAYKLLLQRPHPQHPKVRQDWLKQLTLYGIRAGRPLRSMLLEFRQVLSKPDQGVLQIIKHLQNDRMILKNAKRREKIKKIIRQGWPLWKRIVLHDRNPKNKLQALRFLHASPDSIVIPVLLRVLAKQSPNIQSAAIIALALRQKQQYYYLVDQLERGRRGYTVRYAAHFAGTLMTKLFQKNSYDRIIRYAYLRPWLVFALQQHAKQISYKHTYILAKLYRQAQLSTRWELMKLLEKMPVDSIIWLGKMRKNYAYRCFANDGLAHLQEKQRPKQLRQVAKNYPVYKDILDKHCQKTMYGKK